MEEHHHHLSKIIKSDGRVSLPVPKSGTDQDANVSDSTEPPKADAAITLPPARAASPELKAKSPSEALSQRRASRNIPSSIASNLASARGIPSSQRRRPQPVSPALSPNNAEGKISNDPSRQLSPIARRELVQQRLSGRAITEKPTSSNHHGSEAQPNSSSNDKLSTKDNHLLTTPQPSNDDSFQRFYSNIRDRISSLPSYLSFAGLPLSPPPESSSDASAAAHGNKAPPDRTSTSSRNPSEPNVTNLFSRAALRAVKDDNGNHFGGTESFYVVPTTGGTVSYAGILGREESGQGMRLSSGSVGEGEGSDEFVDALEKPQANSPRTYRNRDSLRVALTEKGKKTMEELLLENSNLKRGIDILSSRLAQWEVGSQAQSMALRQSVMAGRVGSTEGAVNVTNETNTRAKEKAEDETAVTGQNQDAQDDKKKLEERVAKLERENEKLLSVVVRYRERWEKLKEGARTRRDTGSKADDGA